MTTHASATQTAAPTAGTADAFGAGYVPPPGTSNAAPSSRLFALLTHAASADAEAGLLQWAPDGPSSIPSEGGALAVRTSQSGDLLAGDVSRQEWSVVHQMRSAVVKLKQMSRDGQHPTFIEGSVGGSGSNHRSPNANPNAVFEQKRLVLLQEAEEWLGHVETIVLALKAGEQQMLASVGAAVPLDEAALDEALAPMPLDVDRAVMPASHDRDGSKSADVMAAAGRSILKQAEHEQGRDPSGNTGSALVSLAEEDIRVMEQARTKRAGSQAVAALRNGEVPDHLRHRLFTVIHHMSARTRETVLDQVEGMTQQFLTATDRLREEELELFMLERGLVAADGAATSSHLQLTSNTSGNRQSLYALSNDGATHESQHLVSSTHESTADRALGSAIEGTQPSSNKNAALAAAGMALLADPALGPLEAALDFQDPALEARQAQATRQEQLHQQMMQQVEQHRREAEEQRAKSRDRTAVPSSSAIPSSGQHPVRPQAENNDEAMEDAVNHQRGEDQRATANVPPALAGHVHGNTSAVEVRPRRVREVRFEDSDSGDVKNRRSATGVVLSPTASKTVRVIDVDGSSDIDGQRSRHSRRSASPVRTRAGQLSPTPPVLVLPDPPSFPALAQPLRGAAPSATNVRDVHQHAPRHGDAPAHQRPVGHAAPDHHHHHHHGEFIPLSDQGIQAFGSAAQTPRHATPIHVDCSDVDSDAARGEARTHAHAAAAFGRHHSASVISDTALDSHPAVVDHDAVIASAAERELQQWRQSQGRKPQPMDQRAVAVGGGAKGGRSDRPRVVQGPSTPARDSYADDTWDDHGPDGYVDSREIESAADAIELPVSLPVSRKPSNRSIGASDFQTVTSASRCSGSRLHTGHGSSRGSSAHGHQQENKPTSRGDRVHTDHGSSRGSSSHVMPHGHDHKPPSRGDSRGGSASAPSIDAAAADLYDRYPSVISVGDESSGGGVANGGDEMGRGQSSSVRPSRGISERYADVDGYNAYTSDRDSSSRPPSRPPIDVDAVRSRSNQDDKQQPQGYHQGDHQQSQSTSLNEQRYHQQSLIRQASGHQSLDETPQPRTADIPVRQPPPERFHRDDGNRHHQMAEVPTTRRVEGGWRYGVANELSPSRHPTTPRGEAPAPTATKRAVPRSAPPSSRQHEGEVTDAPVRKPSAPASDLLRATSSSSSFVDAADTPRATRRGQAADTRRTAPASSAFSGGVENRGGASGGRGAGFKSPPTGPVYMASDLLDGSLDVDAANTAASAGARHPLSPTSSTAAPTRREWVDPRGRATAHSGARLKSAVPSARAAVAKRIAAMGKGEITPPKPRAPSQRIPLVPRCYTVGVAKARAAARSEADQRLRESDQRISRARTPPASSRLVAGKTVTATRSQSSAPVEAKREPVAVPDEFPIGAQGERQGADARTHSTPTQTTITGTSGQNESQLPAQPSLVAPVSNAAQGVAQPRRFTAPITDVTPSAPPHTADGSAGAGDVRRMNAHGEGAPASGLIISPAPPPMLAQALQHAAAVSTSDGRAAPLTLGQPPHQPASDSAPPHIAALPPQLQATEILAQQSARQPTSTLPAHQVSLLETSADSSVAPLGISASAAKSDALFAQYHANRRFETSVTPAPHVAAATTPSQVLFDNSLVLNSSNTQETHPSTAGGAGSSGGVGLRDQGPSHAASGLSPERFTTARAKGYAAKYGHLMR